MKDFEKNYLEYSDSGVYVKYTGENGIDIDDYIQSLLDKKDKEWKDKIENLGKSIEKSSSITMTETIIKNNLNK